MSTTFDYLPICLQHRILLLHFNNIKKRYVLAGKKLRAIRLASVLYKIHNSKYETDILEELSTYGIVMSNMNYSLYWRRIDKVFHHYLIIIRCYKKYKKYPFYLPNFKQLFKYPSELWAHFLNVHKFKLR
jgi:hypothetical protein